MSDSSSYQPVNLSLSTRPIRDGVTVGLVLFVVALTGIFTTHQRGMSAYEEEVHSHLLDMARAAAAQIDVDELQRLQSSEQNGSELHQRLLSPLTAMLESVPGIRYAYAMRLVDGQAHFVLDAPSAEAPNEPVAGVMERYPDADPEMLTALHTGQELVTKDVYTDEWGTFMSGYVPLRDHAGNQAGIVGIDMTATEYFTRINDMRRAAIRSITLALLLSVFGGFAAGYMRRAARIDRKRQADLIDALCSRESELREKQSLLSSVLDSTADGILVLESIRDEDGQAIDLRIIMANPAMERMMNAPASEVTNTRLSAALPGTVELGLLRKYLEVIETGQSYVDEIRYDRDGLELWCNIAVVKLGDGIVITASDTTERNRIERALQKSKQHLRALIDTTPACVKVVDADGCLVDMNTTGLKLIEADHLSEVRGACVFDLLTPECREQFIAFHEQVCRGESGKIEYQLVGRKGTRRWMLTHAAPLVDPETGQTQHVAITHDITDRKRADREIALNRERFELMIAATRDVIWDYDIKRDHLWLNENLLHCFGYDLEEARVSIDWWCSIVHPDDRPHAVDSLQEAIDGTNTHWSFEYRLRRADGTYASVLDRARIIRDESGKAIRCVGAIVDLTEQKQTAEKLAFQKSLLESQAEASPDGILVVDRDRRVISRNRRFAEMWGIPDDVLMTNDDKRFIDSILDKVVDPDQFVAVTEALTRDPERCTADQVHMRDGRVFDRHSASIRGADGEYYGRVWFFRDVTDQKRYERELEQHKLVVENSNAVLFRWQNAPGWPVELVSENIKQFGYAAEELLEGKLRYDSIIHSDDLDRVAGEVAANTERGVNEFEQDYRILCRDGSIRWIFDRSAIVRDENGKPSHYQGIIIDITERKEAEERFRESEERLRQFASQVPGALYQFRLNPDGTRSFPYISEGVSTLCGIPFDELDCDPVKFEACILPEDREGFHAAVEQSARTLEPWRTEFRIRHRDGSLRWISGNSIPQCEPDGAIIWHGLIIDITDRKRAEEQLLHLKAIIETTPDFVCMATTELEPIYINPSGRSMLDINPEDDLADVNFTDFSASWASDLLQSTAVPTAIRDGIWVGETAFLRADGSELPVSQAIIAHKDADGNVVHLSTIARDMARQKHAENDIRRSRQFLRSTLDALSAHIAILDSSGRIIEVNEAWRHFAEENALNARHFGTGMNYLATCENATGEWSEYATDAARGIRRLLDNEIDHFELEYPCHAPGVQRWFALRATHFETSEGRFVVVAHENITESILSRQELERARDAAEASSRAKSEFLANMSHEIRTPMTAVLGYADLLMDTSLDAAERKGYIEVIHRNGNHLLTVINDILDISKIESGKMTVELTPHSPSAVLNEAVELIKTHASEKNLSLDVEFQTDIPETMQTDSVRLRQILLNVLSNAIKFTRSGGIRVLVRYETHAADEATKGGGELIFDIVDTGIGLTDEQVAKLFQPFVQADNSMTRRFGGTGLGLVISRRLAELLGGNIEITQTGPEGSTFTLRLPVDAEAAGRMICAKKSPPIEAKPATADASTPALNCRILIAEDGPDNQRLISFHLSKAGADVTVVGDGEAARNVALDARDDGRPFDVILMDMQMPVMDGYTATRQLREQGYTGLIVALTAHAMDSDRDDCLEAGCDEYLTKPIDRRTLIESISRFLHDRNLAA